MEEYRFAVISDIHYYSPALGTSGRAYEIRSDNDQKCLAESGAVLDAAARLIASSDVSAAVISGDITNDGEKCSHEEIKEKLTCLNEKKEVYLLTSTHDWCSDRNARRFEGDRAYKDVEAVSPEELAGMYDCFGKDRELASFRTSKGFYSRVFALSDGLRLIMVNDDCDGKNGSSGYSPEHLSWMTGQIKKARSEGADVIAAEHHLLLHKVSPLVNRGQSISDNFETAAALADAGLRLIFAGHSHMQRTTEYISPSGNKITQVNVGALTGYPAPVNFVEVKDHRAHVRVELLEGFEYDGKKYGADFFREHTLRVLYSLIEAAGNKNDLFERLASNGIRLKNKDRAYPFIGFILKKLPEITVGRALGAVDLFTFGKAVDRKALKRVGQEKLLPHAADAFLNVFDGSLTARSQNEDVKKLTSQLGSLPYRVVTKLPFAKNEKLIKTTKEISGLVDELMYPSTENNMDFTVELT